MKTITKHYVVFSSPGTLFSETSEKEIPEWDTRAAMKLAQDITERYGAKPYGFHFESRREADPVKDDDGTELRVEPKLMQRSGTHYIMGTLRSVDDVRKAAATDERILLSNMECNGYSHVVETRNSFLHTGVFGAADCIVDADGTVTRRGSDQDIAELRDKVMKDHEERWKKPL